jgi:hypothetical protein
LELVLLLGLLALGTETSRIQGSTIEEHLDAGQIQRVAREILSEMPKALLEDSFCILIRSADLKSNLLTAGADLQAELPKVLRVQPNSHFSRSRLYPVPSDRPDR